MIKRHTFSKRDRANLSEDSINNESAAHNKEIKVNIGDRSHQQSSYNFSIREVPELVARLHKSPSASTFHRASTQL